VGVYLESEGYEVVKLYSGIDALAAVKRDEYDLAILDLMLPGVDGLALCRAIRENHHYPIIMLTAKGEETDKITGLTLGADDYITKPFRPLELVARAKAQLRRYKRYSNANENANAENAPDGTITYSDFVMNVNSHECLLNDKPLSLTPTEFAILRILLERKGGVVSSEELFRQIWQEEYYTKNNNTITVHVRHLREKMNDTSEHPRYIKTVWGVGYKIDES
jgi:two-component system response regulator VanR